jgi:hypothetical protein
MGQSSALVTPDRKAEYARSLFIQAVNRRVPKVAEALRTAVLPSYEAIPEDIRTASSCGPRIQDLGTGDWECERDFVLWRNVEHHTELEIVAMRTALLEWSRRFHLESEWLLDTALFTLRLWDHRDAMALRLHLIRPGLHRLPNAEVGYPFSIEERDFALRDSWEAGDESWKEFEIRVKKEFDCQLAEYRKRLLKLAQDRGWQEPPEIRSPEHFDWLALYQAAEKGPGEIKKELGFRGDNSRILKAIKSKAKLIGLSLRSSPKGRPKGQRRTPNQLLARLIGK